MIIRNAIGTVLREIVDGAGVESGWTLNPRDPGLLRSLDRISAEEASRIPPDGFTSVAAHVEHVRYGLSLLNRASKGENPFADADWSAAWDMVRVSDAEWCNLRAGLEEEAADWQENFASLIHAEEADLTGVIASVAHLAYHLGAIRQISPATRGPADER